MNYNENTGQKLSPTIDLQSDNCKNYLKEKKRILLDLNGTLILVFAIFFAILYIFTIFVNYASADDTQDPFEPQHNAWFAEEQKIQKAIRLERLEVCKEALEASTLSKNEIY
jgi:hypothetical protein